MAEKTAETQLQSDPSISRIAVAVALVAVTGGVSLAQRFGEFEGAGAGTRARPRDFHDGGFSVYKWMFQSAV